MKALPYDPWLWRRHCHQRVPSCIWTPFPPTWRQTQQQQQQQQQTLVLVSQLMGLGCMHKGKDSSTTTPASKKEAPRAAAAAHAHLQICRDMATPSEQPELSLVLMEQAAAAGQAEEFCAQNVSACAAPPGDEVNSGSSWAAMLLQLHRQTMQREELPLTTAAAAAAVAGAAVHAGWCAGQQWGAVRPWSC